MALEHAEDQAEQSARCSTTPVSYPDLAGRTASPSAAPVTPEDVETFERCISVGGVAVFPADTVYGLATEPDSREEWTALPAEGPPPGRRP